MKCRSGVNKVSWADRTGSVLCRLAGKSGQGRVLLLARHAKLHNFAIFIVLNFERGEKLETALLSISILWQHPILSLFFSFSSCPPSASYPSPPPYSSLYSLQYWRNPTPKCIFSVNIQVALLHRGQLPAALSTQLGTLAGSTRYTWRPACHVEDVEIKTRHN